MNFNRLFVFYGMIFLALMAANTRGDGPVSAPIPPSPSAEYEQMKAEAAAGNVYQQFNLGQEYMNGFRGPRDPAEAAKWFRKAADQGNLIAAIRLGDLFKEGTGVRRDWKEAARWFSLAATRRAAGPDFSRYNVSRR